VFVQAGSDGKNGERSSGLLVANARPLVTELFARVALVQASAPCHTRSVVF
jgi:hypothetical protein